VKPNREKSPRKK